MKPYTCDQCNERTKYNEMFDAYYCEPCNEWMSKKCSDPKCEYCSQRPEKPMNI